MNLQALSFPKKFVFWANWDMTVAKNVKQDVAFAPTH